MSALTRPEYHPDEPSRYAPKCVREGHLRPAEPVTQLPRATPFSVNEPAAAAHEATWTQEDEFDRRREPTPYDDEREPAAYEDLREPAHYDHLREEARFDDRHEPDRRDPAFEGDIAIRQMREAGTFKPQAGPQPRWKERPKFPLSMLVRTTAAIAIATTGALVYVGVVPLAVPPALQDMFSSLRSSSNVASENRTTVIERPTKLAGRLGEVAAIDEQAASSGPATTQVAAPAPAENARAVRTVTVAPWPTSSGPQSPAAAAPQTASPPTTAVAPQVAPAPSQQAQVTPGVAAGLVTRQLDPDEIDSLIRRGETFILQGDFSAARLMLQRAAEAGSGRAAVTLGATYDPVMLRKVGVVGFKADPALAREWYERAIALGSAEASARIAELGKN